ncbi:hypothetical protein TrLO_g5983 [Triparma laevis f. longispina]|uniref:Uncharacterized protein n=1 Tax=Triparma laevis f. longispina TaxID=1714387 RepID=A0A9W7C877_9STRA|nr:hypothetical protein TrLO_g5983 [Triparma laevis f. longispina]
MNNCGTPADPKWWVRHVVIAVIFTVFFCVFAWNSGAFTPNFIVGIAFLNVMIFTFVMVMRVKMMRLMTERNEFSRQSNLPNQHNQHPQPEYSLPAQQRVEEGVVVNAVVVNNDGMFDGDARAEKSQRFGVNSANGANGGRKNNEGSAITKGFTMNCTIS